MSEENKALADRFHMDVFQEGNLDAADEILSADFAWHGAWDLERTSAVQKAQSKSPLRSSVPSPTGASLMKTSSPKGIRY